MDKIYVAIKHVTHFDWERKEIIGGIVRRSHMRENNRRG